MKVYKVRVTDGPHNQKAKPTHQFQSIQQPVHIKHIYTGHFIVYNINFVQMVDRMET